ncbi:MAG: N-acetyl-gamma-glutamyl-phosphate reductase [Candidatus Altiarchaeota archaeon]|nr:N-acetyl-gamma-glutamyl-phosphate reductase [Candidatus Altiarchaeota archaeon]
MDATIIGGSGYSGSELLRILSRHPKVETLNVTSRQHEGKDVSMLHQNLLGVYDKKFLSPEGKTLDVDVVFMATPHGEAMNIAPRLVDSGIKVIDLSADYRFRDIATYEKNYQKHSSPELNKKAVYGLPEAYRKDIKKAQLVANPGCYPTSVILGMLPLTASKGKMDLERITVDSMSGTSGAGIKASEFLQHSEVAENLKAYNVGKHRHRPEMESILSEQFKSDVRVSFTPTLAPIVRGIQSNIHVHTDGIDNNLPELYRTFYEKEHFVRITETPNVKSVNGTNYCDMGVWKDMDNTHIIIISVIDNLVKGAAGQAVQNMNIMMGYDETLGLTGIAGHP